MKILKTYFLISCITVITISARSQTVPNIADSRLDFSLPDMKGDSLQLSSLKGKVFLLDFWASWCVPCRFSNKNLVKLYSKYKSNGFEILSVSLDDNKHDWMKAVNKDKITWLQIMIREVGMRSPRPNGRWMQYRPHSLLIKMAMWWLSMQKRKSWKIRSGNYLACNLIK